MPEEIIERHTLEFYRILKVLVFLQGTVLVESSIVANTREEMVQKSRKWNEKSGPFSGLIPIGDPVRKIRSWKSQGAEIFYMTASRKLENVKISQETLAKYGFPTGPLVYRRTGQSYADVASEVSPDVIVEDDCESIGGPKEMVHPNLPSELKNSIVSVVVREFEGIDRLPNDPKELSRFGLRHPH